MKQPITQLLEEEGREGEKQVLQFHDRESGGGGDQLAKALSRLSLCCQSGGVKVDDDRAARAVDGQVGVAGDAEQAAEVVDKDHVRVVVEGAPGDGLAAVITALQREKEQQFELACYRKE